MSGVSGHGVGAVAELREAEVQRYLDMLTGREMAESMWDLAGERDALLARERELREALQTLVADMEQTGIGTHLAAYQAARAALKGQG